MTACCVLRPACWAAVRHSRRTQHAASNSAEDLRMTVPTDPGRRLDAVMLGELNDLLALDHDAVEAYTLAIGALANLGRRETVMRFRADHERHIAELTRVIRRYGGTPVPGPLAAA